MTKLLKGLAVASTFAFLAASAQACEFHTAQTASAPSEQVVAMSTIDSAKAPATGPAASGCAAGQANCVPAEK
jgi:hypothetical protein